MAGLGDLLNRKQWPVVFAALAVVIVLTLAFFRRPTAVDPRVTLEQERVTSGKSLEVSPAMARLMDAINGEVSRTADRVTDVTTLALTSGVYLVGEELNGRRPRDVQSLVSGLAQKGLLPPKLAMSQSAGTLMSPWGSVSLRYRPSPLGVEVVSVASKPEYGPAMIVRVPQETSVKGEVLIYVAKRLQGVNVPAPFAAEAEVIALGWSPERLRSPKSN